jgi:hypothetical protein
MEDCDPRYSILAIIAGSSENHPQSHTKNHEDEIHPEWTLVALRAALWMRFTA